MTSHTTTKQMLILSKSYLVLVKAYKRALTKLVEDNIIKLDDEGMSKI